MTVATIRSTGRLWPAASVVATAAAIVVTAACSGAQNPAEEAKPAPPTAVRELSFSAEQVQHSGIKWTSVESTTMTETVEIPGKLAPNEDGTFRLGAPARGRVLRVRVQVGDRVSRGQTLVTLQSQEANSARADYAKALADLNSRQVAANYARAARDRSERLLEVKAGSRQDVERARADDELSQAARAQAQAEVDRASTALTNLGVDSETGEMTLRTPIAGIVLSREAVPGSVVDAGAPLVVVTDPSTLWLEIAATEKVAATLRSGARVRFSVSAFPSDTFEAKVQNVGGGLDPATRTLAVRALAQNESRRLRPEMFATVLIDVGAPKPGVLVPDGAVQLLDERPVVFFVQPDAKGGARFERRDVEIGAKTNGQTQIVRGLDPGSVVVTEGTFAVKSEFARSKMPSQY
jgi:cobalt-zinc-cadmium efflux system membrane fusion protein